MKIILSRKGFDTGYGGIPSVILPSNELVSFPIPDGNSKIQYSDISTSRYGTYADLIFQLNNGVIKLDKTNYNVNSIGCHLDPDICLHNKARADLWRGILGQAGASQTHLENMGVDVGDVFLFFGWFKKTELNTQGKLVYSKNKNQDKHLIFGYLEIAEILKVNKLNPLNWQQDHVHVVRGQNASDKDTVYIAREKSQFNENNKGYGVFEFHEKRVLTQEGLTKSKWDLPDFFKNTNISYHSKNSWKDGYFQSAAKGQEFVVDVTPEIYDWLIDILS